MFSTEQAQAYLAAMIDGEGWVGDYKGTTNNREIRIHNTDPELIEAITECLTVLGISYRVNAEPGKNRPAHWTPTVRVEICGHTNLRYILEHVPIRAARKRERLARLVASFKVVAPIDEAELRRLYLEERMTDDQVAEALGVGKKRVILARQRYGIAGHTPKERAPMIWAKRYDRFGKAGRRVK